MLNKKENIGNHNIDFQPEMVRVGGGHYYLQDKFRSEKYWLIEVPAFEISKFLVTQELWESIMNAKPSFFKGSKTLPVEQVSWLEIRNFLKVINSRNPGPPFRLPLSLEWEYAAMAGKSILSNEFPGSESLEDVAWYEGNSNGRTHPVGQKKPNGLGLYDMSGNVWEWCSEAISYHPHRQFASTKISSKQKIIRGGGFLSSEAACLTDAFYSINYKAKGKSLGFRLARSLSQESIVTTPPSQKPYYSQNLYFSYAGVKRDNQDKKTEKIVNQFYASFSNRFYRTFRGHDSLKYGDSLLDYMKSVGRGRLIMVFLSDSYLKSEYCMYELYEVARNCKFEKNLFHRRILLVRIQNLGLDDPMVLEKYFDYWSKKKNAWENLIRERTEQAGGSQFRRYEVAREISAKIGDLCGWLSDIYTSSEVLFQDKDMEDIRKVIRRRLTG